MPFRFFLTQVALLIALVAASGGAHAQAALDLTGRALLHSARSARGSADASMAAVRLAAPSDVRLQTDAAGQPAVDVFVRLDNAAAVSGAVAAGLIVQTMAGDVAVGRVAVADLGAVAEAAGVMSVSISRVSQVRWRNDAARADTRVDAVYAGTGLPRAYSGTGVVVGVVDSGIDYDHPAFDATGGNPGLVRLLELLPDGPGQPGGQREFTAAQIAARTVTEVDPNGHGTHVAGTAVGGTAVSNARYRGVAPGAELVAVKGDRAGTAATGGFGNADVIAAITYVFDYAASRGLPAVVNLSLGGHSGPHDGTSDYERALDNLAGPGRIIVAAAGNEGTQTFHAGYASAVGTVYETVFTTTLNPVADQPLGLYGYAPAGAIAFVRPKLYATSPNGGLTLIGRPATATAVSADGTNATGTILDLATGQTVLATFTVTTARDPNSGDTGIEVTVMSANNSLTAADSRAFGLETSGSAAGRVDVWLRGGDSDTATFLTAPAPAPNATRIPGDALETVGQPATAKRVISVGAYTTTNTWVDIDGNQQTRPTVIGERADFSSAGPTRDGRTGVDISAPGNVIASAFSQDTPNLNGDRSLLLPGGLHNYQQGTSMSSPHVAGIVALMLQADRTLTPERVLQVFRQTSRTDANTGTLPNTIFGVGKVDALAAMQAVVMPVADQGGALAVGLSLDAPAPNPAGRQTSVAFTLPAAGQARLAVYDVLGREVAVLMDGVQEAGPHRATLATGTLSTGTYVLRLQAGGTAVSRPLAVVR